MSFASPSTTANTEDITTSSDTGMLSSFIYSITSYNIPIPLWFQIAIIIIIMVILITGGYFAYDTFDISYTRNGFIWFIVIAFLNLLTIMVVLIYYSSNTSTTAYKGKQGRRGKIGKHGKHGKSVSCTVACSNNIYLQRIKKAEVIVSTYTPEFQPISNNVSYFNNIIEQGNINYDSFVNGILLGHDIDASQTDSIARFRSLMNSNSIAIFLIKSINKSLTKASDRSYGTFKTPTRIVGGFIPLGDSVYGGYENFVLNSFVVQGDYMFPPSYKQLVSFTAFNSQTNKTETYTLWRPNSNSQYDSQKKKKISYQSIGDICRTGTDIPKVSDTAILNENCVEAVDYKDLTLVFIYTGGLQFNDESNAVDYTQNDTYLIQNNVIQNNIQIFSVWRTPLNTFLTNCNSDNNIINGTIAHNMVNGLSKEINEYGAVSFDSKTYITNMLQSAKIPKILAATIICKHYELELRKELIYYYNKGYNDIIKLQFGSQLASNAIHSAGLGLLINNITYLQTQCDKYNTNLIKVANSISSSGGSSNKNKKKKNPFTTIPQVYDPKLEKHLPPALLKAYNSVNNQILTISVKIENTNTFLDIVNVVFDNGIDSRVAYNSDGIAEGGVLMNEIQETVLRICKMLMPPIQPAYTIKDECLGTFALDRDREQAIKDFTEQRDEYIKLTEAIINDPDTFSSVAQNIRQTEDLMFNKISQLCGYIPDYTDKIINMQLDEFTTMRIKGMKKLYGDMVIYLQNIVNSV